MRMIIEADTTEQALSGIVTIKQYQERNYTDPCIFAFKDGEAWLVKKTKTGYSARVENKKEVADEG